MSATLEPITVPLSAPAQAHGESITSITIRPPKGSDLVYSGYPILFAGASTQVNAEAVAKLICRLGAVPPPTVDSLPIADWNACMEAVLSFFGAAATAS